MDLEFMMRGTTVKAIISENKGRFSAKVQCPLCPKKYTSTDCHNPTSAKYRVRDTLKSHIGRKHTSE